MFEIYTRARLLKLPATPLPSRPLPAHLVHLLRLILFTIRMLDSQTPYIKVVTDRRDDIILHYISIQTLPSKMCDLQQSCHRRPHRAPNNKTQMQSDMCRHPVHWATKTALAPSYPAPQVLRV